MLKLLKINLKKLFFIVTVSYLLIAIPFYLLNQESVKVCQVLCEEKGFDLVVGLAVPQPGFERNCKCFSSITRESLILSEGESFHKYWSEDFPVERYVGRWYKTK